MLLQLTEERLVLGPIQTASALVLVASVAAMGVFWFVAGSGFVAFVTLSLLGA